MQSSNCLCTNFWIFVLLNSSFFLYTNSFHPWTQSMTNAFCHYKKIYPARSHTQCTLCVWTFWLSLKLLTYITFSIYQKFIIFVVVELYPVMWIYQNLFIHLPTDGLPVSFQFIGILNEAAKNLQMQFFM